MNAGRGYLVHAGLFVLATACAIGVWTREEQPKSLAQSEATVWQGREDDVSRLVFEAKTKKVSLEAKHDELGAYFVGELERDSSTPPPKAPDGAAPPPPPKGRTKIEFVAVGAAQKLVKSLATLKAIRALGRIPDERAAEFGLAEPEGTLSVTIRGSERKLIIGGVTAGGGDRYVKDPASGEIYVIDGDAVRDLDTAESKLIERDLHEWKETDVTTADIKVGDKSRQIVRGGPEGKRFWADPSAADQKDETLANWMAKLDRLRPTDYVMTAPPGKQDVLRVEYKAQNKALGFFELARAASADPAGKPDYFVRTERTRMFAKVTAQTAEQVDQDLSSIVK